ALMANNEELRIIAVCDDDQNIYEFRGSDSSYMYKLAVGAESKLVEMTENFRSAHSPVAFANEFVKRISRRIKTTPIISMNGNGGRVEVIRHHSKFMCSPLVDNLIRNMNAGESSCVLTQTNDEAQTVTALLRRRGINCRLIQSMDGIRFWNIAEMRYFIRDIERNTLTPIIDDEVWDRVRQKTFSVYKDSNAINYVRRCLEQFERTYRTKYLSDFREFVFESSIEDFQDTCNVDVVVSTIHKAKGREFDDVYMMIKDGYAIDDQLLRRYYVGMTRAKKRLFIHTDTDHFNNICADSVKIDSKEYVRPDEIILQLTHKDVFLDYFKNRKQEILALRSGDVLIYENNTLYTVSGKQPVARLSIKMQNALTDWENKGYKVSSASVRFIIAWKSKESPKGEKETAVILADLILKSK
ncbi:MAG: ATP-binding domain-containing protein, partial [Duncaniella sp.]|nr:ATP-binding domain-containing protein [Duncaniella sp.]